ncbi:OLC1v1016039C1 [Oldenlandia corymbosa var. corymbosa]|uniref:OLC1v1016039C1 n=1 Tax=Oldenlandia corymbosa var. corymbosa TaxID=529605 RepID=A0AAV1E521_OLDCO|nr:OLC1v1016039C1 [Oldenlandia corymbosa var. corymbosa]
MSPGKKIISTLITSIHTALHQVNLLRDSKGIDRSMEQRRYGLLMLKMFVFSARKLGDNEYLISFLTKLQESVCKFEKDTKSRPDRSPGDEDPTDTDIVDEEADSFFGEMDGWYNTLLDTTLQPSSLTKDEVLEIINSFLENLVELRKLPAEPPISDVILDAMKSLGEQMKFLKNLILFVTQTQGNVELGEDLSSHARDVAVNAACILTRGAFVCDAESVEEISLATSTLVQSIKPIDPELCEAYTDALKSSKFARRLSDASTDQDTDGEDQLQELLEGLRSLRKMILKWQQQNELDVKIKEDIVAVVCNAGVFICSLYQKDGQFDLGTLHYLLEAVKMILAELGEKGSQVSMYSQLAFVDFLLEKLMEHMACDVEPTAKIRAQTIREEFVSLRSFLGDSVELRQDQEKFQPLWDRVLEVAYKVEDLVDYTMVGDLPSSLSASFDSIKEEINCIKSEIKVIRLPEIKVKKVTASQSLVQSANPSMSKEVVGFHNEADSIINRLKGPKKLQIVAIVGMPGIGKTTLAEKIYNSSSVSSKKITPVETDMTVYDVADKLRRNLKRRPYLIFLDDVWGAEVLESLLESFPDDFVGSRIMITSRYHDVAQEPLELGQLNKHESLELLGKQLFGGNGWPTELGDLGMKIADICDGLPLNVVIIAGLLKSRKPDDWMEILETLSSGDLSRRCMDTLELSYRNLPEHLKPCLLYLAAFEEDEQISVKRLVQLWIAEGFVRKVEEKRLSDVAEEYLEELICRSLILVNQRKFDGRVKSFRIHDLIYDFCLQKSKDEFLFHFLEGGYNELSDFNEPHNARRLCIHSHLKHLVESKVYCSRIHSLRFSKFKENVGMRHISQMMHIGQLLRVLDLEKIFLTHGIPSEIGLLVLLSYLGIGGEMLEVPPSIGNLSNLETFIINTKKEMGIALPESFWNLGKLKHFYVRGPSKAVLPMENLDNSSNLYELDRISGLIISSMDNMEGIMQKFPNIRRLSFLLDEFDKGGGRNKVDNHGESLINIVVPNLLVQLESLCIFADRTCASMFAFSFPDSLKKLNLGCFDIRGSSLLSIGKLPNLEVLKLGGLNIEGETWSMEPEDFPKLRFLRLYFLTLRSWSGSDDQFQCLEKLELQLCQELEDMPTCLENIFTLQMIKVFACSETVVGLVKKIVDVQVEDYGNSDLKLYIQDDLEDWGTEVDEPESNDLDDGY